MKASSSRDPAVRGRGVSLAVVVFGLCLLTTASRAIGAALGGTEATVELIDTAGAAVGKKASAEDAGAVLPGEFVLAPIPTLQPALGGGVVLVGMYFHPHQADKPANITGAAAGYTSTDSYLIGAAHDHHFKGGRWRFQGAAGYAKFNLNFNGIGADPGDSGRSLSYSVEGAFVEPQLLYKFSRGWSAGLSGQLLDADISFENTEQDDPILEPITREELNLTSVGVGWLAQKDTRDNRFAPYTGQYLQVNSTLFPGGFSNDLDFRIYNGFYNQYWRVRDKTVLAANVSTTYADGDVPFYRLSKLNFRGVSGDTYWNKFLLQGQAELRQQIHGKWSGAVFAGYGGVSRSLNTLDSDDMIFAGGAGVRYMVSPEQRVALRLDIAQGQDGTMVYISIGEAF